MDSVKQYGGADMPCKKRPFATKVDAMIVLARLQEKGVRTRRQHEGRRAQSRVYLCNLCGKWHVTSERKRS